MMGDVIDITGKLADKRKKDFKVIDGELEEKQGAADIVYEQCLIDILKVFLDCSIMIDDNPVFEKDFDMVKNSLRYTVNRQFGLEK